MSAWVVFFIGLLIGFLVGVVVTGRAAGRDMEGY
jgi:hypothetical protein